MSEARIALPMANNPEGNPALRIPEGATWRYVSKFHSGTCLIAKGVLRVSLELEKFLFDAPDVEEVERWLRDHMALPTTVEAVAVAARERWKMIVTVRGHSDSHGTITVRIPA